MKHKKYELETMEDIANCVNISNIENFLEGFGQGLRAYITAIAISRQALREQGKDDTKLKNSEIVGYKKMTYIDDNKQDNKIEIVKK
jgi:hypothetical protein